MGDKRPSFYVLLSLSHPPLKCGVMWVRQLSWLCAQWLGGWSSHSRIALHLVFWFFFFERLCNHLLSTVSHLMNSPPPLPHPGPRRFCPWKEACREVELTPEEWTGPGISEVHLEKYLRCLIVCIREGGRWIYHKLSWVRHSSGCFKFVASFT